MALDLAKIRARAIALRSSVHNEHQLSAIELAAMNAKKTNELIDVINDLETEINNGLKSFVEQELPKHIQDIVLTLELEYDVTSESLSIKGVTQ